ncbi:hypothetical protein PIB30_009612 [Stylosanthes scabra]|uniref:Brix domain-containing protein n=1 Tax=Stylosanthes scabra TaxID=79078 RepID=A0ABU6S5T1_9FABA|nr:hypothetical protein [Stylosanthes scabra]
MKGSSSGTINSTDQRFKCCKRLHLLNKYEIPNLEKPEQLRRLSFLKGRLPSATTHKSILDKSRKVNIFKVNKASMSSELTIRWDAATQMKFFKRLTVSTKMENEGTSTEEAKTEVNLSKLLKLGSHGLHGATKHFHHVPTIMLVTRFPKSKIEFFEVREAGGNEFKLKIIDNAK